MYARRNSVAWLGAALAALSPATAGGQNLTSVERSHGVMIQLSAERSEAAAARAWIRALHNTGGVLDDLTPRISPVKLPHKGVLYRLRAGPLDGERAAEVCGQLRARGLDCIVVR